MSAEQAGSRGPGTVGDAGDGAVEARDRRRDRTTVRRALRAGAVTWAAVAVPLLVAVLVGRGDGRAGLVVVLLGLTLGGVAATGWMLLATLLDLLAGGRPGGYRACWLLGTFLVTALLPVLVAGVGSGGR